MEGKMVIGKRGGEGERVNRGKKKGAISCSYHQRQNHNEKQKQKQKQRTHDTLPFCSDYFYLLFLLPPKKN